MSNMLLTSPSPGRPEAAISNRVERDNIHHRLTNTNRVVMFFSNTQQAFILVDLLLLSTLR